LKTILGNNKVQPVDEMLLLKWSLAIDDQLLGKLLPFFLQRCSFSCIFTFMFAPISL